MPTSSTRSGGIKEVDENVATDPELMVRLHDYVERVKELEQQNKELASTNVALSAQNVELKSKVDEGAKALEEVKCKANGKLTKARQEWKQQAEAYGRKMAHDAETRASSEVAYLKDLISRLEEQVRDAKLELKNAETGQKEAEKGMRTLEHRLEAVQASLHDEVMLLRQEVERLQDYQRRWEESRSLVEQLQTKAGKLEVQLASLQAEKAGLDGMVAELGEVEGTVTELNKEVGELRAVNEELSEELEDLKTSREEARQSKAMSRQLQKAQAEQEKAIAEVGRLQASNERLEKEVKASTRGASKGVQPLKDRIKVLEAEVGGLETVQEQVAALRDELSMYRTLAAASKDQQFALLYIRDMDTAQGHVCVENRSNMDVSLAGWRLVAEETEAVFDFPEESMLGASSKAIVWWGAGNTSKHRPEINHFFWTDSDKKSIWVRGRHFAVGGHGASPHEFHEGHCEQEKGTEPNSISDAKEET